MKKNSFKIITALLTVVLALSATACNKKGELKNENGEVIAELLDLTNEGVYLATGTVNRNAGAADDNDPGDGTNYRLRVWCAEEDYDMISAMLKTYEGIRNQNTYTWVLERVGEDTAASKVLQDVSAAADVFSFANDQLGSLTNNSALKRIDSKYHAQIEAQIGVAAQASTSGSDYYAIPYSYENCFLYYNKSKITDVSSFDAILHASIPGVTYNLGIDMSDSYYTTMFLYTAGVQIFGPNGNDTSKIEGSLNNDQAKAACAYIKSLYNEKKLTSVDKIDQAPALKNGKIAAMISGPHMISSFKASLGENFAVAMLPKVSLGGEPKQLISFAGVKMYGVSNKDQSVRDNKTSEEAMRVAAFLANADNQSIRLEEREFCPTDQELFDAALESGIDTVKTVVSQSKYAKLKPGLIEMGNYWEPMGSLLNSVYRNLKDESTWATELKKIEDKIKPQA